MNNWNTITLSQDSGHQRSASITGYNGMMNGKSNKLDMVSSWNGNRLFNPYHASFMDLYQYGDKNFDRRQEFPWQNSMIKSQSYLNRENLENDQKLNENALKTAISKMKESSILRLDQVHKNAKPISLEQNRIQLKNDDVYHRNCMTLQPKRTVVDSQLPRSGHKIFKCKSTADQGRDRVSSIIVAPIDCASETESDKNFKDNQYRSVSNLYLNRSQYQEDSSSQIFAKDQDKKARRNCVVLRLESQINNPTRTINNSIEKKEISSGVFEVPIFPKNISKPKSAFPKTDVFNIDNDKKSERLCADGLIQETAKGRLNSVASLNKEDFESKSISSTNSSITRFPALKNEDYSQNMSKSLILNSERPPLKKPFRSGSQKVLDGLPSSNENEQLTAQLNSFSGLYKKTSSIPLKGKVISNKLFDFQKLHAAFLEQKNEIKFLKVELEEKKTYIKQLESEIRSYEPWR